MNRVITRFRGITGGRGLLIATWASWFISVLAVPLTAFVFQVTMTPVKGRDFAIDPIILGAMVGGLLSLIAGSVALALRVKMRRARPLLNRWLHALERLVLVSSPVGLFAFTIGLILDNMILFVALYVAATFVVLGVIS